MSKNNLQPGTIVCMNKNGTMRPASVIDNQIVGIWNGSKIISDGNALFSTSHSRSDVEMKRKKQTLKCSKCEKILGEYYAWQDSYECLDNIGSKEARDILCQDCYLLEKLKE